MKSKTSDRGKLKIGDDWNAIRIIALSQSNPLKAIAEFVENSIDARAKTVTITRGREHGEHYLSIRDDGDGVPRSPDGLGQVEIKLSSRVPCFGAECSKCHHGGGGLSAQRDRSGSPHCSY